MASRRKVSIKRRPQWASPLIIRGDTAFEFDMEAPITGDAIYRGTTSKNEVKHLLVPNRDATQRQHDAFLRGLSPSG